MTSSDDALGMELVRWRGERSARAMAALLAVHENTLGNYERGVRLPDRAFLARFCEVTGADLEKLYMLLEASERKRGKGGVPAGRRAAFELAVREEMPAWGACLPSAGGGQNSGARVLDIALDIAGRLGFYDWFPHDLSTHDNTALCIRSAMRLVALGEGDIRRGAALARRPALVEAVVRLELEVLLAAK